MLFQALKSLLMMLPQSTCYSVLRDRLTSVSRFRQSAIAAQPVAKKIVKRTSAEDDIYVVRVRYIRALHCAAAWKAIRAESLSEPHDEPIDVEEGTSRREWLGYSSEKDDQDAQEKFRDHKRRQSGSVRIEEIRNEYHDFPVQDEDTDDAQQITESVPDGSQTTRSSESKDSTDGARWKGYWMNDQ